MGWLKSRRIHYLIGCTLIFFVVFLLLRVVFLFGFSDSGPGYEPAGDLWKTIGIGLRFDLRLAILMVLPLALLSSLPYYNLARAVLTRRLGRTYIALATLAILFVYIIDFGHYAYLGVRINATVYRFLQDPDISGRMVWQSYPVVWITLGWLAATITVYVATARLERFTLDRQAVPIGLPARAFGILAVGMLALTGILGRVTDINPLNPVPLRWNAAFFSGDAHLGALGLNPVIFLYDTMDTESEPYDLELVEEYYPLVANYLGVDQPAKDDLNYARLVNPQGTPTGIARPPNIIFIMLESLGASRLGVYGNPLNPSPNLDKAAQQGWLFKRFYVPVTGTSKTVWASITGIPDVSRTQTASRNPFIAHQHTIINAFEGYRKFYFIGGNSSWANINALIRQSIEGVQLHEEGDWKGSNVDVWGISDYDLFMESEEILNALPDSQPFFAYIQTAGNHRPFTIPEERHGFEPMEVPEAELEKYGFRNLAQFNAVRLLDFNIGRFLEKASSRDYFGNTIFVFFGDHNNRITRLVHMPPAFERLGLESNHVPHIVFAPEILEPRVIEPAVSLVDMLPSIAGLAGISYRNTTMGRDFRNSSPEGSRVVPLVLKEGSFPVIGAVTQDFLLRMNYDGSDPSLHDLSSKTPEQNVADSFPDEFARLQPLTRGLYETSRYMLYQNRIAE